MKLKNKCGLFWITVVFAAVILLFVPSAQAVNDADIKRLEETIEKQASELEALQKQVQEMKSEVLEKPVEDSGPVVTSGTQNSEIKIYGHVNKAVLYSDDGDKGRGYIVDNDNSSTRFGLKG